MMVLLVPSAMRDAHLQILRVKSQQHLQEPRYLLSAAEADEGVRLRTVEVHHILHTALELLTLPFHIPNLILENAIWRIQKNEFEITGHLQIRRRSDITVDDVYLCLRRLQEAKILTRHLVASPELSAGEEHPVHS